MTALIPWVLEAQQQAGKLRELTAHVLHSSPGSSFEHEGIICASLSFKLYFLEQQCDISQFLAVLKKLTVCHTEAIIDT